MALNVVQFPKRDQSDIVANAREFAAGFESGEYPERQTALLVLDGETGMNILNWGQSVSIHEAIGILETAKAYLINQLIRE